MIQDKKIIDLFNDSTKIRSEAIYKTKQDGTGLKILTPKRMLQRLPITVAQVKAGNNSESLLNEIKKIVYSLYQWKEITKKYTITLLSAYNEIAFNYKNGYCIYELKK